MARPLGKSVYCFCDRGPFVGGLPVPMRKVRRRARAKEKAHLQRELRRAS